MIPVESYLPAAQRGEVTGVILAGGAGVRMGGQDKGLLPVAGAPLIAHTLAAFSPQVGRVLISANRNLDAYRALGWPVVTDHLAGFPGPLAGMAAGLGAALTPWVAFVPCDSPLLPPDLVARLYAGAMSGGACIAVAAHGGRMEPVFCLLHTSLTPSLHEALAAGGRKVAHWFEQYSFSLVDLSDRSLCLFNANTPEEQRGLEARLGERLVARQEDSP
jgi:molybdopterin-guanine dinucleotide biosynthesis protein A